MMILWVMLLPFAGVYIVQGICGFLGCSIHAPGVLG